MSKSLAEFAPAGANKLQNPCFPAACTSENTLYGLQVWDFRVPRRENPARGRPQPFAEEGRQAFFGSLTNPSFLRMTDLRLYSGFGSSGGRSCVTETS